MRKISKKNAKRPNVRKNIEITSKTKSISNSRKDSPKKVKSEDKNRLSKGILKKVSTPIPKPIRTIRLRPNSWNRFEEPETHMLFNPATKSVYGVQDPTGKVNALSSSDIYICKSNKWKYDIIEDSSSSESEEYSEETDDESEEEESEEEESEEEESEEEESEEEESKEEESEDGSEEEESDY